MPTTETNLRPELARHLRQRFTAFGEGFRHNLALIGPPGSGKTFQLQQLLSREPSTSRILIYCPLYRESCRSFLHRFLCAILQAGMPKASASNQPLAGRPRARHSASASMADAAGVPEIGRSTAGNLDGCRSRDRH